MGAWIAVLSAKPLSCVISHMLGDSKDHVKAPWLFCLAVRSMGLWTETIWIQIPLLPPVPTSVILGESSTLCALFLVCSTAPSSRGGCVRATWRQPSRGLSKCSLNVSPPSLQRPVQDYVGPTEMSSHHGKNSSPITSLHT